MHTSSYIGMGIFRAVGGGAKSLIFVKEYWVGIAELDFSPHIISSYHFLSWPCFTTVIKYILGIFLKDRANFFLMHSKP